jgi:hypothetical protein
VHHFYRLFIQVHIITIRSTVSHDGRIGVSMLAASFALEVLVIGAVARKDTSGVGVETGGKAGANENVEGEAGESSKRAGC